MPWAFALGLCLVLVSGCGSKPPPDPNDPAKVGILQPEVLQRNLHWASDMVNERVANGEISEGEAKQYLTKYADGLVDKIDFKLMQPEKAWAYAEVFRTAKRWELAKRSLEIAVEHAKKTGNEDRRVNDSLRLAQAMAELGERKEAIVLARSVFDAPDQDKAPILLAVIYEIAPALQGHGLDVEVAKLIEDAIEQHTLVVIDPESEAGKAFLTAKWFHIRMAWERVMGLYQAAGRDDLMEEAKQRAAQMIEEQGKV